jgi:hypothetical protein
MPETDLTKTAKQPTEIGQPRMVSSFRMAAESLLIGLRKEHNLNYKDYTQFLKKFETRFGNKPNSIGLPEVEFKELEKDLEDRAPVAYSADYSDKGEIKLDGVIVKNSGRNDGARIQFRSA